VLKVGRRRRWQIILPAIVVAAAAAWWVRRLPDQYRSDALLLVVSQRVPETFVRSTVTTRGDSRLQSITQQILSRTQLERIIRDFDLYPERRTTGAMQDVVDSMRLRDIDIQPVKGDAFRLGFVAERPEVAMRVADRLASLFIGQTSLDRTTLAEGADQFLEAELEDARRKLVDTETTLQEYRRRHNGELPQQLEANVQVLRNTEMQIQALADSLNRDRDRQLAVERSLEEANLAEPVETRAPNRAQAAPADTGRLTATEQLERAEAALEELQSTLTEQHPDILTLKQTIAELRQRSQVERARRIEAGEGSATDTLRRRRVEGLRAELSAVERQIAQKAAEGERLRGVLLSYQKRVDIEPTREAELVALTRDYETLQQTYRGLLAKKQESAIAANLERRQIGAQFKVLDRARLPERPFGPNRPRLYGIGAAGGLGIGLLFAFILECCEHGLRTEDDVRVALGLPVLATIPVAFPWRSRVPRAAAVASVGTALIASAAALAWQLLK
jgi:polysaccharide chain length determinant protein (PEP-CTERM system associated)